MITFTCENTTVTLRNQERSSSDATNTNRIITTTAYNDTISKTGFPSLTQVDFEIYETDASRTQAFLLFMELKKGKTIAVNSVTYHGNYVFINGIEVIEEQDARGFRIKATALEV